METIHNILLVRKEIINMFNSIIIDPTILLKQVYYVYDTTVREYLAFLQI